MKIVKYLFIIVFMMVAAGIGFYLCNSTKEAKQQEAAVMI